MCSSLTLYFSKCPTMVVGFEDCGDLGLLFTQLKESMNLNLLKYCFSCHLTVLGCQMDKRSQLETILTTVWALGS